MHFQTLLSPLLKVPRMVLLSSLLWCELGTNLPGPGEWLYCRSNVSPVNISDSGRFLAGVNISYLTVTDTQYTMPNLEKCIGRLWSQFWAYTIQHLKISNPETTKRLLILNKGPRNYMTIDFSKHLINQFDSDPLCCLLFLHFHCNWQNIQSIIQFN